jgi:hypothetical protein
MNPLYKCDGWGGCTSSECVLNNIQTIGQGMTGCVNFEESGDEFDPCLNYLTSLERKVIRVNRASTVPIKLRS